MRLNAQTDFALRVLMLLAAREGRPATIQEAAQTLRLSQPHLMRVCAKLSAGGFVSAARGRNGGLTLGMSPAAITVEAVLKHMEPDFGLVECFRDDSSHCTLLPACLLNSALEVALRAFFDRLSAVTLQDLVGPNQKELSLLMHSGMTRSAQVLSPLTQIS